MLTKPPMNDILLIAMKKQIFYFNNNGLQVRAKEQLLFFHGSLKEALFYLKNVY